MCHAFLNDSSFYQFLFRIDQAIAAEVQAGGCPSCGGVLHSARYPRKPRGIRGVLDESYESRLSFCCAEDGCRRRCTPPSVRFLGRKVYLGILVILLSAREHGLSAKRRQQLIDTLEVSLPTRWRWCQWWRESFAASRCWQAAKAYFLPPLAAEQLPGALLGRLSGADLRQRLCRLLGLLAPLTTTSWSGLLPVAIDPQKM